MTESNLLTKYKVRTSLAHRNTNQFLAFYLQIGLSVPALGVFAGISLLMSLIFPTAPPDLLIAALTVGGAVVFLGVCISILITPIALIGFLVQRRWAALLIYPAYGGVMFLGAIGLAICSNGFLALLTLAPFAVAAFFTVKFHVREMRKIQAEPLTQPPKVLGCGGQLHIQRQYDVHQFHGGRREE